MAFLTKIFGDTSSKALKPFYPIVEQINSFEKEISLLSDEDLKAKTAYFKEKLVQGNALDEILPFYVSLVNVILFQQWKEQFLSWRP